MSGHCLIERDVIHLESSSKSLIERDLSMAKICQCLHFGAHRTGQIALILYHLVGRGRAQRVFGLIRVQRLLLQDPSLFR